MPEEGIFGPVMIYRHIPPERDNLLRGSTFIMASASMPEEGIFVPMMIYQHITSSA